MLKKIKLKNSTVLFIGILFIFLGLLIGFFEFINERKEKAFTEMNISLYENELPKQIEETEDNIIEEIEDAVEEEEVQEDFKYNYIGTIQIPKINLNTGFVDINSIYNNVDYNVAIIKGSTYPNEVNNNLILAAHSGNCSFCYFNGLFNLVYGDVANITYNNLIYSYKLVNTYEVKKDGTVPIYRDYSKSVLTLITCTKYSEDTQTVFIFERVN